MKLKEYKEHFYEFSGKVSDISRQLAFAGIAVVWIFRLGGESPKIPDSLLIPFALLVSCLFFDLLQYLSATCVWGIFQWYKEGHLQKMEKGKTLSEMDETELDTPSWFKLPQFVCFVLKIVSIFLAYFFLGTHLWGTLFKS